MAYQFYFLKTNFMLLFSQLGTAVFQKSSCCESNVFFPGLFYMVDKMTYVSHYLRYFNCKHLQTNGPYQLIKCYELPCCIANILVELVS
jgi:hypothetical protein